MPTKKKLLIIIIIIIIIALKQFVGNLATTYLSVFDHFVGLVLKRLISYFISDLHFTFSYIFSIIGKCIRNWEGSRNLLPSDWIALPPSQTPHKMATNLNLSNTMLQNKILEKNFLSHGKLLNIPIIVNWRRKLYI